MRTKQLKQLLEEAGDGSPSVIDKDIKKPENAGTLSG